MDAIEIGLCQCGCGGKTSIPAKSNRCHGHKRGVPVKFIWGHNKSRKTPGYRIIKNGCWRFLGHIEKSGYPGKIHMDKKYQRAHRAYYEHFKAPIPSGLHLDHLCRNPKCINPSHLEPVTPAENTRRMLNARAHI